MGVVSFLGKIPIIARRMIDSSRPTPAITKVMMMINPRPRNMRTASPSVPKYVRLMASVVGSSTLASPGRRFVMRPMPTQLAYIA
ncbi:hypothetical protein D3C73_1243880 [compost metagenome]